MAGAIKSLKTHPNGTHAMFNLTPIRPWLLILPLTLLLGACEERMVDAPSGQSDEVSRLRSQVTQLQNRNHQLQSAGNVNARQQSDATSAMNAAEAARRRSDQEVEARRNQVGAMQQQLADAGSRITHSRRTH